MTILCDLSPVTFHPSQRAELAVLLSASGTADLATNLVPSPSRHFTPLVTLPSIVQQSHDLMVHFRRLKLRLTPQLDRQSPLFPRAQLLHFWKLLDHTGKLPPPCQAVKRASCALRLP